MLHLHRTFLAAPFFLSLACSVSVNETASDSTTTDGNTTSTTGSTTTNPSTEPTTDPTTTTTDPTTTGSTGEPDPTTDGATTSTTDASSSSSSTGDTEPGTACMGTSDCAAEGFCFAPWDGETPSDEDFTCHPECVDDMGGGNSEMVWCFDSAACCTEGAECNGMGYCEVVADTTGDTDSSSTGDTDGSSTGDTDTGDTDTGGGLQPLILISGLEVSADCMPIVPEDPVSANWTTTFDNKLGMADYTATVKAATLTYSPGVMEFVQGIDVAPAMSGVVATGKTVMKMQSKTKALMDLPMDCGQCGKPVALEVVFAVDGQDIAVTATAVMTCVL